MNIYCATIITLALLNFSLFAAEKFQLRPQWEVGKVYIQESTTDMTFKNPVLTDASDQKTNITQILSIAVTRHGETDRKVAEVTVASLKGTMDLAGQTLSYDSATPAQSPPFLQQAFGTLAGKSFSLVYDQDNSYVETLANESQASATPLGSVKSIDAKQLSDAFRKWQEIPFPKEPVSVGDTWRYQHKQEMPPVGSIGIEASVKFDAIVEENGHQQAKLLIEGDFQLPLDDNAVMRFGPGSKFTGEIYFDLERKVVTRSSMSSLIKMLIDGREAPLTQIVKTKVTSIKNTP